MSRGVAADQEDVEVRRSGLVRLTRAALGDHSCSGELLAETVAPRSPGQQVRIVRRIRSRQPPLAPRFAFHPQRRDAGKAVGRSEPRETVELPPEVGQGVPVVSLELQALHGGEDPVQPFSRPTEKTVAKLAKRLGESLH